MSLMTRLQRPGATNYTNLSPLQQTLAHVGRRKEGRGGAEKIPLLFSPRASSPYGRVARSHASTAREMRRKCQGWGKKFLLCPSRLRRTLARSLDLEMESLLIGYLLLFHPPTLLSTPNPDCFETKYCFFFFTRISHPSTNLRTQTYFRSSVRYFQPKSNFSGATTGKTSAEIVSVPRLSVHTKSVFFKKTALQSGFSKTTYTRIRTGAHDQSWTLDQV